ncbi:NAD(P)-dependent alcohol dehydrogenase [Micrococcales bacterium 31B]|nr:NAD(P)-dependent alcohol dehydrogenase [Micrococcales bacterium 31B]
MATTVSAWGAPAGKAPLEKMQIERRELGEHDIYIDVKYAGICHSDIHTVRDEWGPANYPLVPGHEIAGVVSAVGNGVTLHQVGDLVGVGCFVDSCRECAACREGDQQYCEKGMVGTYNATHYSGEVAQGGYAQGHVVDENYALKIPASLPLDKAAPLLCAGITVYSPLKHWNAGPGKRVAVVGMGGLGHMAVKIAAAMGADVTVLSQSLSKLEDGLRFGAKEFYATSDPETFTTLAGSFDMIINTVAANIDINATLSLVKRNGSLVLVGAPENPDTYSAFSLIGGRKSLAGSMIGGIEETQEMLDFCAEHNITPEIEVISAESINEAYDRVVASDVRYRFVIDAATI